MMLLIFTSRAPCKQLSEPMMAKAAPTLALLLVFLEWERFGRRFRLGLVVELLLHLSVPVVLASRLSSDSRGGARLAA